MQTDPEKRATCALLAPIARRAAIAFCLAAALLSTAGCGRQLSRGREQEGPVPVRAVAVETKTIRVTLDYAADIKAMDEVLVYPKVSGKIAEKSRHDGQAVAKGEPIAYIDRDEVGFTFQRSPVESPLTGVVGRVLVDLGANVTPQTPVASVVNYETVRVKIDAPEKYLPRLTTGLVAEVRVDAWPERVFTGTVYKVSPVVDAATRTSPLEVHVPNQDRALNPGMFCRVRLVLEERKDVPVVPKEAVVGRPPQSLVYVVQSGVARARPVKLGLRSGSDFEILEGLTPGDKVVVMGQQRLRDGTAVLMEEQD